MNDPSREPLDVIHPLLGVQPPDLDALIERADAPARRVLEAMRRFHRHRVTEQQRLRDRIDQLHADDLGPFYELRGGPPHIVPNDLLRALLAIESERIAGLFGDLRRETFTELVERVRETLASAPEPGSDDVLDIGWARRWALADERDGRPSITPERLIASLGIEGLACLEQLSEFHAEGLITSQEVGLRVAHALQGSDHPVFTSVPPAYLDREDGLQRLETAFAESGRVLIVGPPHSGRSALLQTWLREGSHERPIVLDPHRSSSESFPPGLDESALVGITAPRITARESDELLLNTGLMLDADELTRRRRQWLEQHAPTLVSGGPAQLVMVIEPYERSKLISVAPALSEFREVRLSEPQPLERAMIWLAHTLAHAELGLTHVLSAVRWLGPDVMSTIDPWALTDLVDNKHLRAYIDEDGANRGMFQRRMAKQIDDYARGGKSPRGLARAVLRLLGGEPALPALLELEATLYGPRDAR